MCEKDEALEKEEKEKQVPKEKDLISMYNFKKLEFSMISFLLYLVIIGGLVFLLPEEASISRERIFEFDYFDYFVLIFILAFYTFFSFREKASELDLVRIAPLYFYTLFNIYIFLPEINLSFVYLDLSNTENFLRLFSSILILLVLYPINYFLAKWMFKKDRTVGEWKERERKKKEGEEEKQEQEKE